MLPLDLRTLRSSFVNASRKEVADMTPPPWLDDLDDAGWARLDLLGWRDPRLPSRAYVVTHLDAGPVGVLLRPADAAPRRRAQCAWCEDVTLPNDVVFYAARRRGPAGRAGDTVGTLVCRDFECSANVRVLPPLAYEGFDRHAARDQRVAQLGPRVAAFVGAVLGAS